MIAIERVYETSEKKAAKNKAKRILVDRVWPRGIKKESLRLEAWAKDVAPSNALRKWFGHDPERWKEFQSRYGKELRANPEAWKAILEAARRGGVTLLYGARDTEHNNAVALRNFLEKKLGRG